MNWDGQTFRCDCGGVLNHEDTIDSGMDFRDGRGWQLDVFTCLSCKKEVRADVTYAIKEIEISEA